MRKLLFLTLFLLFSSTASAYIGQGLGAGAIGVILGILGSLLLAIFALFWYPLKRIYKKLFPKSVEKETPVPDSEEGDTGQ